MHDESWLSFYTATQEIEKRLGLSKGAAQKKLREACASGDPRSRKQPYVLANGEPQEQAPWERIEPSEWRLREIDLMTGPDGCNYFVDVSADDFRLWLNALPQSKPAKPRRVKSRIKRNSASQAIDALWPEGIPGGIVAKDIERRVRDWLKAQDLSEVSRETILRAAGRK